VVVSKNIVAGMFNYAAALFFEEDTAAATAPKIHL
jgi:hypothetical protein